MAACFGVRKDSRQRLKVAKVPAKGSGLNATFALMERRLEGDYPVGTMMGEADSV